MKKTLKWRLAELPTGDEIAQLVEQQVISKDEARDILFNEEKEDSNKLAALKEEVKFLRELCDTLASKSNGWTTIIREYHDYKPRYPVWYQTYGTLMQNLGRTTYTSNSVSTTAGTLNLAHTMQLASKATSGLSSLNK